jgi:hypothetical protein
MAREMDGWPPPPTVNKLRSINLFFSSMFRIGRTIVYVGRVKNHHFFIYNKFTLTLMILALLLMTRKVFFMLMVKFDKKYADDFLKYLHNQV